MQHRHNSVRRARPPPHAEWRLTSRGRIAALGSPTAFVTASVLSAPSFSSETTFAPSVVSSPAGGAVEHHREPRAPDAVPEHGGKQRGCHATRSISLNRAPITLPHAIRAAGKRVSATAHARTRSMAANSERAVALSVGQPWQHPRVSELNEAIGYLGACTIPRTSTTLPCQPAKSPWYSCADTESVRRAGSHLIITAVVSSDHQNNPIANSPCAHRPRLTTQVRVCQLGCACWAVAGPPSQ